MEIEISSEKKEKKYGKYDEYEIKGAADTLIRAEEIKADKDKMKYISECMKEKLAKVKKAVSSISDLRKLAEEKSMED